MKTQEINVINLGSAITVKTANGFINGVYMGSKPYKNGKGCSVFYISLDADGIARKHRALFNAVAVGTHNVKGIARKYLNNPDAKITERDLEILGKYKEVPTPSAEPPKAEPPKAEPPKAEPCPSLDLEALIAHKIEALIASKIEEVLTKMLG